MGFGLCHTAFLTPSSLKTSFFKYLVFFLPLVAVSAQVNQEVIMPLELSRYDIPRDVTVEHVISDTEWSSGGPSGKYQHTQTARIPLPISSSNLFLLKKGGADASNADITSSSSQDRSTAIFQVMLKCVQPSVCNDVLVAKLSRRGQIGVGIFTPRSQHMNGLEMDSTILFPESASVHGLSTDVPNTSQRIHGLGSNVKFENLALSGSGGPIDVESVNVDSAAIKTSNSDIKGTFRSSGAIALKTNSGTIDVKVELDSSGRSTSFDADNSNGEVKASMSLTSRSGKGGIYNVSTKTSNAPMKVDFPTAPVDSNLNFSGQNSNGKTHVQLHPTYEGAIHLQDSKDNKPILNDLRVSDPTGQGRTRTIETAQSKSSLSGRVHWGRDRGQGNVALKTTHNDAILEL